MFEMTFDRMAYPIGYETTITRPVRKWKNRPALTVGQPVTIVKLDWEEICNGTFVPRVQVKAKDGSLRWVSGTNVEPCTTGNESALKRLGEIADEFFARRD